MRNVALLAIPLMLAGCAPSAPQSPPADTAPVAAALTCTQEVTRTAGITSPDAKDLVTVRSFAAPPIPEAFKTEDTTSNGALCTNAVVFLTIHSAQSSAPLLALASRATALDMVEGHAGPAFDPAALKALLERFATVEMSTTDQAPAFGAETVSTGLDRAAYAALQASKAPMLCIMESIHHRVCRAIVGPAPYTRADVFFVENMS